jgi:hypothetical protein
MGEAKRRAAAYEAAKAKLLGSLTGDGLVVAGSAIKLFEGFILPTRYTGGCYLTNMVLHRYLKDEHGIETEVIVGYINDGTDDIYMSHGWLEHEGRKTDLTIHLTEHPEVQLPGNLLVADQVLRPGRVTHTYHRERPVEGLRKEMEMMANPDIAPIVAHKAEEHQAMLARAKHRSLLDAYLGMAPKEMSYEAMTAPLRR